MIQIRTFKEKRKEGCEGRPPTWWPMEGSKLGGQWGNILLGGRWKVLNLVAFEMNLMPGGQWGSILLRGHWKVLNLVALEMNLIFRGQWGSILIGGHWKV